MHPTCLRKYQKEGDGVHCINQSMQTRTGTLFVTSFLVGDLTIISNNTLEQNRSHHTETNTRKGCAKTMCQNNMAQTIFFC